MYLDDIRNLQKRMEQRDYTREVNHDHREYFAVHRPKARAGFVLWSAFRGRIGLNLKSELIRFFKPVINAAGRERTSS